jgi:hydrogenase nickel incorporation protein HypA/HybF
MHELSIAYNIVHIAEQAATEAQVERVTAVHLQVGALSGVVADALRFSYDLATQDTCLAGSDLKITELPVIIYCAVCQQEQTLPSIQLFCCPECNTPSLDIRQGKELDLIGIEVDDETETARP